MASPQLSAVRLQVQFGRVACLGGIPELALPACDALHQCTMNTPGTSSSEKHLVEGIDLVLEFLALLLHLLDLDFAALEEAF